MTSLFPPKIDWRAAEALRLEFTLWLEGRRRALTRAGVLASLALFTVGASLILSTRKLVYGVVLAALPFLLWGAAWLQGHLEMTGVAILVTSGFIPFSLPTGTSSRIVASLALAGVAAFLWFLRMAMVEKRFRLEPSPVNLPAIGFMLATLASLAWSNVFRDPTVFVPNRFVIIQAGAGVVMILSPLVMLQVGNLVRREQLLRWMVAVMLAIGGLGATLDLLHVSNPVNNEGLTNLWVISLALSLAFFDRRLSRARRALLLILAGATIYWGFIVNISWLAGWLPGFIAIGLVSLIRSRRLFLAMLALLAVYAAANLGRIQADFSSEKTTSGDTRMAAWQMNWEVTGQHLLLGTGPAGYAVYYMTYNPNDAMATHSNYIDVISQTGLIGAAFYLWLFGALFVRGARVYWRLRGRGDFTEALAVGALGGLAGCIVIMGFGDWLLPFAYTQTIAGFNYSVYSWVFMGTILSLDFMTRKPAAVKGRP